VFVEVIVDVDFGDYFVALSPIGNTFFPLRCKQRQRQKYIAGQWQQEQPYS
jgi:hypothetical protein